jgi:acyl carrier protein
MRIKELVNQIKKNPISLIRSQFEEEIQSIIVNNFDKKIREYNALSQLSLNQNSDTLTPPIFALKEDFTETEMQIFAENLRSLPIHYAVLDYINKEEITNTILILKDIEDFIKDQQFLRYLINFNYKNYLSKNNHIIIISKSLELPNKLTDFVKEVIYLPLTTEEIKEIIYQQLGEEFANEETINLAKGLTEYQLLKTISDTIVDNPDSFNIHLLNKNLRNAKKEAIEKVPGLKILEGTYNPMVESKETQSIEKAIKSGIGKGALLFGIPGTGKTEIAKHLSGKLSIPIIQFNIEDVMDKYVGNSELRMNMALKTLNSLAPIIVFIDEIEKIILSLKSSTGDSGVGNILYTKFLIWLQEKPSDVFVIATANEIEILSQMAPEFVRAGRWNLKLFIDLPSKEKAEEILKYYCNLYDVKYEPIELDNLTPAEIKAIVENAKILDIELSKALKTITPILETSPKRIERLRKFARENCTNLNFLENNNQNNKEEDATNKLKKPSAII